MEPFFIHPPRLLAGGPVHKVGQNAFIYPLHAHEETTELLLIVEGEGEFRIDGKLYKGGPGTLLCYNQGVWHEERNTSDVFSAYYLTFMKLQLAQLPYNHLIATGKSPVLELGRHYFELKQIFAQTMEEKTSGRPHADFIADQLLGVLLGKIIRALDDPGTETPAKSRSTYEAVLMTKRHIEEKYNETVTLNDLSRLSHLNQYHLSHLFKREFGVSPIQHLIRYRMEVAKVYLKTYTYTNKEIAELIGYESDTYFQQIFKKTVGLSPGEYRSRYKENE